MSDIVRFQGDGAALLRRLRDRARVTELLRAFFRDRGFLEVETPIVVSSPGVEVHLAALETSVSRRRMYLTTSPEFHMKRLIAAGAGAIFQATRAFRDGEAGGRHNPEFGMVEWYRTGVDYGAIMDDCEALLAHLARGLLGSSVAPEVPGLRPAVDLSPPWPRVTFREAFARAGEGDPAALATDDRTLVLAERVEPLVGTTRGEFLIEYPADAASLGRLKPSDPTVAERFEAYAGGLELANGFSELTDADAYVARCEADLAERRRLGLPGYPVDARYVSMLREGLPPCAGVALGLDRVVMLLTGAASIRDVMAFPIDLA
ncbi:MAG: elongation factor P--(R)-beta-lysine ligase [Deltaproteobacteria bacterium]|nr:elongation factor P--(R)-beta-lysine ligase [Deltaproteobacteria bacterium]